MYIKMPSNAHKDAAKMRTKTHMPSSCTITITWHWCAGIWSHVQLDCLVDSFFADHGDHYWSLHVVHCLPVDSPHGWPVMWEAFRYDDSIIINLNFPVRIWSKMAQAEIILSAAILDGLVTKIADVLRTVFSSYFVDIKCSCLVKCHCGIPLVVQSKISHH